MDLLFLSGFRVQVLIDGVWLDSVGVQRLIDLVLALVEVQTLIDLVFLHGVGVQGLIDGIILVMSNFLSMSVTLWTVLVINFNLIGEKNLELSAFILYHHIL